MIPFNRTEELVFLELTEGEPLVRVSEEALDQGLELTTGAHIIRETQTVLKQGEYEYTCNKSYVHLHVQADTRIYAFLLLHVHCTCILGCKRSPSKPRLRIRTN